MKSQLTEEIEVLLIEDDPNDAELVIRSLKKSNMHHHLKHVEDGVMALKYLRETRERGKKNPRIIILDLSMPKINGIEVLGVLKEDEMTRNIPIVVFTSSMEEKDLKRCYELGVNSYVVKPVDYSEFSETITNVGDYWLRLNLIQQ